jgi:hypothetical protein
MNDSLEKAVLIISGAFVSGCIGLVVFYVKRRQDAKDQFAIVMSQIAGKFDRPCDPLEFYDSTFSRLEDAVFQIVSFINASRRHCLTDVWRVYCGARDELQKSATDRLADTFNSECLRLDMPLPKNKREIISFFHGKLLEAIR